MNDVAQGRPLKVCMVVQKPYPFMETRVQRAAEALVERGHLVSVVCLREGSEPKSEGDRGVMIHRVALKESDELSRTQQLFHYLAFWCLTFLKLSRLQLQERFDVVHVHNLPDVLVFAALIPRLTGSRVILDIHDLMPEFYCSKFNKRMDSLPVRMLLWQELLCCRFAHGVITVTEQWRETLIERSVPAGKCFVVMNLADPRYFWRCSRGRDNAQGKPFRLLFHGSIVHRYGIDLLLRAVHQVRSEIPNVHLRIHGAGDYLEATRNLVRDLALADCVEITTGSVSLAELVEIIRSCHVGIVPYRRDIFTDGILPTKLMEYVAVGLPVLVSRTPIVMRYFGEDAVEFFDPGNVEDLAAHVRNLYHNEERRRQIARNSAAFNQRHDWRLQKEAYVGFLEELCRGT